MNQLLGNFWSYAHVTPPKTTKTAMDTSLVAFFDPKQPIIIKYNFTNAEMKVSGKCFRKGFGEFHKEYAHLFQPPSSPSLVTNIAAVVASSHSAAPLGGYVMSGHGVAEEVEVHQEVKGEDDDDDDHTTSILPPHEEQQQPSGILHLSSHSSMNHTEHPQVVLDWGTWQHLQKKLSAKEKKKRSSSKEVGEEEAMQYKQRQDDEGIYEYYGDNKPPLKRQRSAPVRKE